MAVMMQTFQTQTIDTLINQIRDQATTLMNLCGVTMRVIIHVREMEVRVTMIMITVMVVAEEAIHFPMDKESENQQDTAMPLMEDLQMLAAALVTAIVIVWDTNWDIT